LDFCFRVLLDGKINADGALKQENRLKNTKKRQNNLQNFALSKYFSSNIGVSIWFYLQPNTVFN
jgi:hypothetical protein